LKATVYLDTTIPSFYFETREDSESVYKRSVTVDWWDNERYNYQLFVSEWVRGELSEGNYPNKQEVVKLIEEVLSLKISDEIADIVDVYLKHKLMPQNDIGDAFHLAFASFYKMDYLLTWNCNHLANANKQRQISIINAKINLCTPRIITPELLFRERK